MVPFLCAIHFSIKALTLLVNATLKIFFFPVLQKAKNFKVLGFQQDAFLRFISFK